MAKPLALLQGEGLVLGESLAKVELRLTRDGSIDALQACRSASLVIEGIRSNSAPGAGWALFLAQPAQKVPLHSSHPGYVGSFNFFGTSRVGPDGRKVSFPVNIDFRAILDPALLQTVPMELRLEPTNRPAQGSVPRIGLVTLWCIE